MLYRSIIVLAAAAGAIAFGECGALAGERTPDDPAAKAPRVRYSSVMGGTKAYMPVDPLPWGDVNRRVAPKPQQKPKP